MTLSEPQIERFSRQILLREIGGRGQERLLETSVALSKLGPGGRACALWLARAGVGRLILPDERSGAPAVDPAGLLLSEDVGKPLADVVRQRLMFHAPHLAFGGESSITVDCPAGVREGALAAINVVRELLLQDG